MALEKKQQVEQLADQLTASADEVRARLMQAIKKKEISPENARATFQSETSLRQQANGLYIDAAVHIVKDLDISQQEFTGVIENANQRIAKVKEIAAFLDLVADLLALAAAVYAGKPKPILAAFEEVRGDLKALPATGKASGKNP
jgi:oligoendopeptidase F